jgi:hypothetical protein
MSIRNTGPLLTNKSFMNSVLDWFRRRIRKADQPNPMLRNLLQLVATTQEREINCDEVFALLDQFVEVVRSGENDRPFMPPVRQHLAMCPDCREEYEALVKALQPVAD